MTTAMPNDSNDITGLHPATFRRRLFLTVKGYLGLAAENVVPGDRVVVLPGGQLPYVLRLLGGGWALVGEAYVDGVMDGEVLDRELYDEMETFEIR